MFDEEKFRSLLKRKGKSVPEVAAGIGISKVTLYRKMSGESDFFREEIQNCCSFLEEENLNEIFFAQKVT